jgi:FkbM family methyltransferase
MHTDDVVANHEIADDPLDILYDLMLLDRRPVIFIDVGCNYGIQLMRMARAVAALPKGGRVLGFDPGRAAELLPYSLLRNGLGQQASFYPIAVAEEDGLVEVYGEPGNSLDNHIGDRGDGASLLWIAPSVSLRSVLATICSPRGGTPLYAKIDAQGIDQEILRGAGPYLDQLVFISELTPWVAGKRIDLPAMLGAILRTHIVVDIGPSRDRFNIVTPGGVDSFLDTIYRGAPYWTDILAVPHAFKAKTELVLRHGRGIQRRSKS